MTWDRHALTIIPIKAKELTGSASVTEWKLKSEICMDLKRYDCAEEQMRKIAEQDSQLHGLLGNFQLQRGKIHEAANSFHAYFNNGHKDAGIAYSYAKTLIQIGQSESSIPYFELALKLGPDLVQVTVLQKYVKILIDSGRLAEAQRLIEEARSKLGDDGNFMDVEMRQIQAVTTASR